MDIKEILSRLTETAGVSGDEYAVSVLAADILGEYGEASSDRNTGCVYFKRSGWEKDKPVVLLDAHIDEIGMIVTYITDDGFLKVSGCGGLDNRVLLAQQVTVCGRERLVGIVTSTPPHLEKDSSMAPETEAIYIDIGLSGERARKLVDLGDRVLIENCLAELQDGRVTSKALDDRSGMAAVILALDKLKGKKLAANVAVLFSSQEEIGEMGAQIGAYSIDPDMAVVVDVSFAKTHGESPENCGELGGGPMIGIAPSLSRRLSEDMLRIARENHIPYQTEVMGGKTGTNADAIGIIRGGVPAVTVSIPERYMHTPAEVVEISDIENTAELIAKFLESV